MICYVMKTKTQQIYVHDIKYERSLCVIMYPQIDENNSFSFYFAIYDNCGEIKIVFVNNLNATIEL